MTEPEQVSETLYSNKTRWSESSVYVQFFLMSALID